MALALVATSGAALLAVGPRLLGEAVFGGLALQWTISTIFGLGVAAPTEQLVNRRLNVEPGWSIAAATWRLWIAAIIGCVLVALVLGWSDAQQSFPWLVPGACLAVLGWSLCALSRGRLLGAGDMRAYGQSQAVEGLCRLLLLAAAMAGGESPWVPAALAAAVGLPLFAGGLWALVHQHRAFQREPACVEEGEHAAFVMYALGYQACVNALPLVLEWRSGEMTGPFVVANSYFRAALIVVGGVLVHALTNLSLIWGRGDRKGFDVALRRVTVRSVLLAACASLAALAAAPFLLPLLYGGPLGLETRTGLALASSTVLAVAAAAQATGLLAAGRPWRAVVAWAAGTVAMLAAALVLPVDVGALFWAPIVAAVVPLVAAVWLRRD